MLVLTSLLNQVDSSVSTFWIANNNNNNGVEGQIKGADYNVTYRGSSMLFIDTAKGSLEQYVRPMVDINTVEIYQKSNIKKRKHGVIGADLLVALDINRVKKVEGRFVGNNKAFFIIVFEASNGILGEAKIELRKKLRGYEYAVEVATQANSLGTQSGKGRTLKGLYDMVNELGFIHRMMLV